MKRLVIKFLFTILFCIVSVGKCSAVDFNVLVLPTNLFSVCDNYFCFPEAQEIIAEDVILNLNDTKHIHTVPLAEVRARISQNQELKNATENMLKTYQQTEKIDFQTLNKLSSFFNTKSAMLISTYTINDQSNKKRNLWETLEIASAFKITYPFQLVTNAVLTDTVNDIIMWSNRYSKTLSDNNGYFLAQTQAQAASQLEKIKLYSKTNIAQNITQNVQLRFFPKEVRTVNFNRKNSNSVQPQFTPNALDNLITPKLNKELEYGQINTTNPNDDYIFEF